MNTQDTVKTIEDGITRIAALTDEAAQSAEFQNWLNTFKKFWNYSFTNQFLIAIQRPDATHVAGYKQWQQKFERTVNKGEHGIGILAPKIVTDKETGEKICVGFIPVTVFDVAQTSGKPLPTIEWYSTASDGELNKKLVKFADSKGIKVSFDLTGKAQGVSMGGSINLKADAGTSTLVHEIAHELMHRGEDKHELTREDKELEAETVGFVVTWFFGIDTGKSAANYLANWRGDSKAIKERMTRIANTARMIIEGVQ